MSEEETYSLNDGHHSKRNTYRCSSLCTDAAHKISIGKIVERCHQHTDNSRQRQLQYQSMHRCGGHLNKFRILLVVHIVFSLSHCKGSEKYEMPGVKLNFIF